VLKKHLATLALMALMFTQVGVRALADEPVGGTPSTASGNIAWKAVSFPLRLVTGITGGAVGMVGGGMKGIVTTEEKFAANTFGKADENPLLVVPGILGTVVAVPVGFVVGAPEGTAKGAKAGYQWWNNF
jgi:hypothetical protein